MSAGNWNTSKGNTDDFFSTTKVFVNQKGKAKKIIKGKYKKNLSDNKKEEFNHFNNYGDWFYWFGWL